MNCLHRLLYELAARIERRRDVPCHYDDGDVLAASFPKSGSTWMRFILANIARTTGGHDEETGFHTIHRFCPEIARTRSQADRECIRQQCPQCIDWPGY